MGFFRLLFYFLVIYFIWKLIEPYIKNVSNVKDKVKGNQKQKRVNIDPNDIEDADFKEIDDDKS
ncbi:MAG: hypothetical protein DRP96_02495 [Candidatus Neomarinimicrobiota bacterium]|nr:MAG: hypothetical protein DRP96_02495 [Candidatus Neomarinimicrobiota bacterium]